MVACFKGDNINKNIIIIEQGGSCFIHCMLRLHISSVETYVYVFYPRTVQLIVSNALVGRIIGRGGMKINSIQVKLIEDYSYMYT